jgi:predicted MFS family arabinose efflux permease
VPPAPQTPPPSSLVALLAVGGGLCVAALYYNQPMLGALGADLGGSPARLGLIPALTQLGYAAGLILSAPLGDRLERRGVIVAKSLLLTVALVVAGLAPTAWVLCAASLAIGLFATTAQDLVPVAAAVALPEARGKTVGTVMTGLLLGILLSRVVSGAVSQLVSWRAVFLGAAGTTTLLAGFAALRLPRFPPSVTASYPTLLASMASLAVRVAPLRRAAITQGLLSVAFSGFWSTLALGLESPPYHFGSLVAGSFGLAGAAGALAAPIAGAVADKRGGAAVIRFGAALSVAAFAAMAIFYGRHGSLPVLIAGTVAFDLGVQASLIAHQTIVYSLDPAARSRLNAILVGAMFIGMSVGAFLASRVFGRWGFAGVCVFGAVAASAALAVRLVPERR